MTEAIRFALLGPVRAWRGERELAVGSPQQRAVLAVLLLNEGRQVSVDELVNAIWGDDPPRSAVSTLRTYVYRLRRTLAAGTDDPESMIVGVGGGYLLPIAADASDLGRFGQLHAQALQARQAGERAVAIARSRAALALWTGIPLAGLSGRYVETQRTRLAESRLAVIEERLADQLDLGRHVDTVAELSALVAEHPLRERLRELQILALYRAGRQAEALESYQHVRLLLADELGIDPGHALRDLHHRILNADPRLIPAAIVDGPLEDADRPTVGADRESPSVLHAVRPAQLPADLSTFTGRAAEVARVCALLTLETSASAPSVVAIDGMAGIGKTALAVHCARATSTHFPDGQLHLNLRGFDPRGSLVDSAEALRGFLQALGVAPAAQPEGVDAQSALYRTLLDSKRVLIVLDNARDLDQIRPLVPGAAGCAVLITSRNRLGGLVAVGAHGLSLALPSVEAAREVLTLRLGAERVRAELPAVNEIIARCGRLPLAMALVAAHALAHPTFPLGAIADDLRDVAAGLDLGGDDVTNDVRTVFSWSYQLLGSDAARLFRLLPFAQPGTTLSRAVAASVLGVAARPARRLIAELTNGNLLGEPTHGRFAMHDLLRAYAMEQSEQVDTDAERRVALERVLDYYLHSAVSAQRRLLPFRPLADPPPPRSDVLTIEEPGDREQAVAWQEREHPAIMAAIARADECGFHAHVWRLALSQQQYFQWQGLHREWRAVMGTALAATRAGSDRAAEADVRRSLAGAHYYLDQFEAAGEQLEETQRIYQELGDLESEAYVLTNLSEVASRNGQDAPSEHHLRQALKIFHSTGNLRGVAQTTGGLGLYEASQGRHDTAISYTLEAMRMYHELGDANHEANYLSNLAEFHRALGQYEQANGYIQRALDIWREVVNRPYYTEALVTLGDIRSAAGEYDAARGAWHEAIVIADQLRLPVADEIRDRIQGLASTR